MSNSAWLITSRLYASLCFFQLWQLHFIRSCLTMDSAKTLVHAFISSRLDYCNSLLVGAADCVIRKLQGVQNAAARLITGTRKFDHITSILRDFHWLSVHQGIKYKITMLVNKCLQGLAPHIWLSFANQWLSLLDVGTWGRLPPANWVCNGQPQLSVAGTLLFPVQTFGTAYQPTCIFHHCRRQHLHDTWRHTCSAALNDMICLQCIWVSLRLRCL